MTSKVYVKSLYRTSSLYLYRRSACSLRQIRGQSLASVPVRAALPPGVVISQCHPAQVVLVTTHKAHGGTHLRVCDSLRSRAQRAFRCSASSSVSSCISREEQAPLSQRAIMRRRLSLFVVALFDALRSSAGDGDDEAPSQSYVLRAPSPA